jgi:carbon storage regulator
MLVLTRRAGEEIVIDERIRIVVTAVRGDRVRLGITAPADVRVDRQQVYLRRGHAPYRQDPASRQSGLESD